MKRVFRSIINIKKDGKPTIAPEELVRNWKAFLASSIKPEDPSYVKLYTWIEAHYRAYKELPSIELLFERAASGGGPETVLASLKDVAEQIPYIKSDYLSILKEKFEAQNLDEFRDVLTNTWKVVKDGIKIDQGRGKKQKEIKGLKAALGYMAEQTRKFRIRSTGVKTDSMILSPEDRDEVIATYDRKHNDPLSSVGLFTYLDRIDEVFRGVKLGDLMIVAAFTSQFKSTMVANFAYNGIMQGMNGMFVPQENSFADSREFFYTLHTTNPEWYDNPKYRGLAGKVSLEKLRYGELSDAEYEFFKVAADDFSRKGAQGNYGELKLWQPTEALTPSSLEYAVDDCAAEFAEKGKTLDFLVVDYCGLMVQDKSERYGDFNVDLNAIIKRLKQLAVTFNEGKGLRVISPFQVNRDGWKEACKNDGIYKLTALSNANEAERSADKVITIFLPETMRNSGIAKVACLKHRGGKFFEPFEIQVDYTQMKTLDVLKTRAQGSGDGMGVQEIGGTPPPLDS